MDDVGLMGFGLLPTEYPDLDVPLLQFVVPSKLFGGGVKSDMFVQAVLPSDVSEVVLS